MPDRTGKTVRVTQVLTSTKRSVDPDEYPSWGYEPGMVGWVQQDDQTGCYVWFGFSPYGPNKTGMSRLINGRECILLYNEELEIIDDPA